MTMLNRATLEASPQMALNADGDLLAGSVGMRPTECRFSG